MATNNLPEEKQIIKFIEKVNFSAKNKKTWIDQIRATGFNEELATSILKTLTKPPKAKSKEKDSEKVSEKEKEPPADLALHAVEFNGLVRRWRMALQSKKFSKR